MGWSVDVQDVVMYVCTCSEIGCVEEFPIRARRQDAEDDRAKHMMAHADAWLALNKKWEDDAR